MDPVNTAKDMRVRANSGATVSIAAYGGGNSSANVITYLQANNTLNNGATADNLGGGVFANGPAACAVP